MNHSKQWTIHDVDRWTRTALKVMAAREGVSISTYLHKIVTQVVSAMSEDDFRDFDRKQAAEPSEPETTTDQMKILDVSDIFTPWTKACAPSQVHAKEVTRLVLPKTGGIDGFAFGPGSWLKKDQSVKATPGRVFVVFAKPKRQRKVVDLVAIDSDGDWNYLADSMSASHAAKVLVRCIDQTGQVKNDLVLAEITRQSESPAQPENEVAGPK